MKKRWIALLAACCFAFTGCGGEKAETDSGLEPFRLVLDWYPNGVHAFLYTAMEKGYFAEEGLELTINFPANPNDGISLPAAGKADAGIYYLQDAIMTSAQENVPVVSIGALTQSSLNVVIALEESDIHGAADLAGKKVGYAGTVLSEEQIKAMLENEGISPEACEFVDVGFDLLTALTTKQVDATIGNMVNHEVPQLEANGFSISHFYPTDFGVPQVYELVFLAGKEQAENNPEKLQRFLRACKKGFDDMKANPEESLQILLDNQNAENFPLSKEVEKASIEMLLPVMETADAPFLSQKTEVWQENADWLYERGILSQATDVSSLVVNLMD